MCVPKSKTFSLARLIREHASALAAEYSLSEHHWKVLNALKDCRTGALGHVVMDCEHCGARHTFPLSCGNRHCPQCTGPKRESWRAKQCQDLLPVPYFHLVFTLPHVLNPLIRDNREVMYTLLFAKTIEILQQFAEQTYGGRLGITAILHTWGQAMGDHYHLHLMIPGGVLRPSEKEGEAPTWVPAKKSRLFPVRQLALCFRGAFIKGVEKLYKEGKLEFHSREMKERVEPGAFQHLLRMAARPKWNVFSEKSRVTPVGALNYLARYSHRVAFDERRVSELVREKESGEKGYALAYRDNRDGKNKSMDFTGVGLLKRFSLHILPPGFVRVRHYGFLANGKRQERLEQARVSIEEQGLSEMATPESKNTSLITTQPCPKCQVHALRWVMTMCVTEEGRWVIITPATNEWRRRQESENTS